MNSYTFCFLTAFLTLSTGCMPSDTSTTSSKSSSSNKTAATKSSSPTTSPTKTRKSTSTKEPKYPFPRLSSTQYVDDDLHLELTSIDHHIGFLIGQVDEANRLANESTGWKPIQEHLKNFQNAIKEELELLKEKSSQQSSDEINKLFDVAFRVIDEDADRIGQQDTRVEYVGKISTHFFDKVKAESSKQMKDVPSELRDWTQDYVKEYANFPSTVKFGWFPSTLPSKNNQSAVVIGSLRASNAFGLETSHEYRASWQIFENKNGEQKWTLCELKLDEQTVYTNPEVEKDLIVTIADAMAKGEYWSNRRGAVESLVDKMNDTLNDKKRWDEESREFVSDKGTTLVARYSGSKGVGDKKVVVLEKSDGTTLNVEVNRLSTDDRNFIGSKSRSPSSQTRWQKEARTFTSTKGTTLKARLKNSKGSGDKQVITLEKEDTTTVTLSIKLLSDEDQEFIQEELKSRRRKRK